MRRATRITRASENDRGAQTDESSTRKRSRCRPPHRARRNICQAVSRKTEQSIIRAFADVRALDLDQEALQNVRVSHAAEGRRYGLRRSIHVSRGVNVTNRPLQLGTQVVRAARVLEHRPREAAGRARLSRPGQRARALITTTMSARAVSSPQPIETWSGSANVRSSISPSRERCVRARRGDPRASARASRA